MCTNTRYTLTYHIYSDCGFCENDVIFFQAFWSSWTLGKEYRSPPFYPQNTKEYKHTLLRSYVMCEENCRRCVLLRGMGEVELKYVVMCALDSRLNIIQPKP